MEKFGIFELLDTLSALTAGSEPAPPPEESGPAAKDGAFAPPSYPAQPPQPPAQGRAEADALQGFLARHDAVARKADKKS